MVPVWCWGWRKYHTPQTRQSQLLTQWQQWQWGGLSSNGRHQTSYALTARKKGVMNQCFTMLRLVSKLSRPGRVRTSVPRFHALGTPCQVVHVMAIKRSKTASPGWGKPPTTFTTQILNGTHPPCLSLCHAASMSADSIGFYEVLVYVVVAGCLVYAYLEYYWEVNSEILEFEGASPSSHAHGQSHVQVCHRGSSF